MSVCILIYGCVCMCLYMYVHLCVCIYIYIYIYISPDKNKIPPSKRKKNISFNFFMNDKFKMHFN